MSHRLCYLLRWELDNNMCQLEIQLLYFFLEISAHSVFLNDKNYSSHFPQGLQSHQGTAIVLHLYLHNILQDQFHIEVHLKCSQYCPTAVQCC